MDESSDLDARGLLCPLPVLKARKRLAAMAPGALLRVWTDDPAARVDVPHFCTEAGHRLRDATERGDTLCFLIEKAHGRGSRGSDLDG